MELKAGDTIVEFYWTGKVKVFTIEGFVYNHLGNKFNIKYVNHTLTSKGDLNYPEMYQKTRGRTSYVTKLCEVREGKTGCVRAKLVRILFDIQDET